jgi:hypothetical protein
MYYEGAVLGLAAFVIIGVFHPVVIKAEYYVGVKIWPLFLVLGIAAAVGSVFIPNVMLSGITGIFGFTCLWTIRELYEQVERVKKGWFPQNPKRS